MAGALTFRGPADTPLMRELLEEIERGDVSRVAFAVPWGATWALPAYELALMTAAHLSAVGELRRRGEPRHTGGRAAPALRPLGERRRPRPARRGGRPLRRRRLTGRAQRRQAALPLGRRNRGRPRRRAPAAARAEDRRHPPDGRGLRLRRRALRGARRRRGVRGGRHHELPDQAGRDRRPAGRGRRGGDRGARGRLARAASVQAGPPRPAPDGQTSRSTSAAILPATSRSGRARRRSGGRRRRSSAGASRRSSPLSPARPLSPTSRRPPAACRSSCRSMPAASSGSRRALPTSPSRHRRTELGHGRWST